MVKRVVHAVHQSHFDKETPSSFRETVEEGLSEGFGRMTHRWNEPQAQRVVDRVKRPRELHGKIARRKDGVRRGANGRERDVCGAKREARRITENGNGGSDRVEVVERLAHSHEDNVTDRRKMCGKRVARRQ